jgi:hypothetical protein
MGLDQHWRTKVRIVGAPERCQRTTPAWQMAAEPVTEVCGKYHIAEQSSSECHFNDN